MRVIAMTPPRRKVAYVLRAMFMLVGIRFSWFGHMNKIPSTMER